MPAQQIIRNDSNMDRPNTDRASIEIFIKRSNRHSVAVTVDDVIIAIANMANDQWTTTDVAVSLKVPERAVRGTIRNLLRNNLIRKIPDGRVMRTTRRTKRDYTAQLYEIRLSSGPADFDALNRAFVYGR